MHIRSLARDEIDQIWTIDRSEVIEHFYALQDGALVLQPGYFHLQGWPPGQAEQNSPHMYSCFDRGGRFYRRLGTVVAPEPDPELYALEPEDIHLVCPV